MTEPTEHERYQQEQDKEWGAFVATSPIFYNGARAFNPGQPVPASHVKLYGYDKDGLVAKTGTKAAEKATADTTPEG